MNGTSKVRDRPFKILVRNHFGPPHKPTRRVGTAGNIRQLRVQAVCRRRVEGKDRLQPRLRGRHRISEIVSIPSYLTRWKITTTINDTVLKSSIISTSAKLRLHPPPHRPIVSQNVARNVRASVAERTLVLQTKSGRRGPGTFEQAFENVDYYWVSVIQET